jgi:hypothetical protein
MLLPVNINPAKLVCTVYFENGPIESQGLATGNYFPVKVFVLG